MLTETQASSLDALAIRKRLGRKSWGAPERFGPDGWAFATLADDDLPGLIIVTVADFDGVEWVHASQSFAERMPSYDELRALYQAVFLFGWAYEVFAPPAHHINIARHARHLWGRLDGAPALPNFGALGTI